ncbi:MAG TPA: SDR family oxidoreductase [Treponema sp.]|jgi:nucleoside-diphosphate-sugar epimerase|uniref:SDR family oxidoreductase n=1 Tax=Gracilinema caldarium TaxID=215591 RepID=UPI0026ECA7B3|nr:SDR family oxidoreductase [Gracilinema caldarium]HON12658.1 SDR family oxidoreductase [Treponema sp.]HPC71557.1 SDR family oxidoreductase [Treponema sp.]HRS04601.1 SDR family oxidoreductase [Treponema sp.]HRU29055.1 SDR family oxidoreductase [Treponema sp.]
MKILFIGGTGNLSWDTSLVVCSQGHELFHLNRGLQKDKTHDNIHQITADIHDEAAVRTALGNRTFDVVADFIAYTIEDIERDIRLFSGRTGQYVFISSASAYRKPPVHHVITEATPLVNPYWEYSQNKIRCEARLQREWLEKSFPITIIRPSHTYSKSWLPTAWTSSDFTVAARMLAGKPVVVHGDGQSLWTLTHSRDFAVGLAGLLGNRAAIGEVIQITGDEALTWDAIHHTLAQALGVEPKLVHIPSDFIARIDPEMGAHFLGDKTYSAVFDCSKLKRLVPAFKTTISFNQGIRESVDWYLEDPSRQKVNIHIDGVIEKVLSAWNRAMDAV